MCIVCTNMWTRDLLMLRIHSSPAVIRSHFRLSTYLSRQGRHVRQGLAEMSRSDWLHAPIALHICAIDRLVCAEPASWMCVHHSMRSLRVGGGPSNRSELIVDHFVATAYPVGSRVLECTRDVCLWEFLRRVCWCVRARSVCRSALCLNICLAGYWLRVRFRMSAVK